jgi:cytochrome P450
MAASAILRPPGPKSIPIFGRWNALVKFFRDPILFLNNLHQQYGKIAAFTDNGSNWFAVFGPEGSGELLTHPDLFHSGSFPETNLEDTALRRLGTGLLSMEGSLHRQHRHFMQPYFHHQEVGAHHEDIIRSIEKMLDGWQLGAQRDICQDMHHLATTISILSFFGITDEEEIKRLGLDAVRWIDLASSPSAQLFRVRVPLTAGSALYDLSEELEAHYRLIVAQKREDLKSHHDILSSLLQARDAGVFAVSDDQIIGQTHLLTLGGIDTFANGMTWTLFLLDQYPGILADLSDEIDGVLRGASPKLTDLQKMPLLERVIKESLRILPPLAYLLRKSVAPAILLGFRVPQNAKILYSPYVTHHLPDLYPMPERFYPDRWLNRDVPPFAYIPFGAGIHTCIGANFAMMAMKLAITMVVQRYRLHLVPGAQIDRYLPRFVLSSKQGMPMTVHTRQEKEPEPNRPQGNIREMVEFLRLTPINLKHNRRR